MENYTEIAVILDRSGSMGPVAGDMCGGFDSFVAEQKKNEGKILLSLYQFDDEYEVVYEAKDIKEVNNLVLYPRGTTALLDAIGKTIVNLGIRLAQLKESERPNNVIVVIITDGYENASKEFVQDNIKQMIKLQEDTYNWKFIYLGANQDAINVANGYGINSARSMSYSSSSLGAARMFSTLTSNVSMCHNTNDSSGLSFSASDRAKQDALINQHKLGGSN